MPKKGDEITLVMYTPKKPVPRKADGLWARFNNEYEARRFARAQKCAEVVKMHGEGKGLIGQYNNGKPTPEFADREWEFE